MLNADLSHQSPKQVRELSAKKWLLDFFVQKTICMQPYVGLTWHVYQQYKQAGKVHRHPQSTVNLHTMVHVTRLSPGLRGFPLT